MRSFPPPEPPPKRSSAPSLEVLDRYLAGEASAEEVRTVMTWSDGAGVRAGNSAAMWNTDAAVDALRARMSDAQNGRASRMAEKSGRFSNGMRKQHSPTGTQILRRGTIRVFAAVVMLLGIVVAGSRVLLDKQALPHTAQRYEAGANVVQLTLRDGSRIRLAPGARLSVPTAFNAQTRTVALSGEAWFDVRSAAGAPFVVATRGITTRVLGTVFTIRDDAMHGRIRVSVISGRVAVRNRDSTATLNAGTLAQITDSTATAVMAHDIAKYADWQTGQLVFDDASVSDVLRVVGGWYGYEFRVTDSTLARRRVMVAFTTNDSMRTLATLRDFLGVSFRFDGSVVTVSPVTASPQRTKAGASRQAKRERVLPSLEVGK